MRQSTRASQKLAQQWLANRGARIPKFAPPPLSRWTKVDSLDSPEPDRGIRKAQSMGISPPFGGKRVLLLLNVNNTVLALLLVKKEVKSVKNLP